MRHYTSSIGALVLSLPLLLSSCAHSVDEPVLAQERPGQEANEETQEGYLRGMVRIKVTEELHQKLKAGGSLRSGNPEMDAFMEKIGAKSMVPTFRHLDPRFEKRHRKAGLHLWYTVEFDETRPVTRAVETGRTIPGVEIIEAVPELKAPEEQAFIVPPFSALRANEDLLPGEPNDTRYGEQWHLRNTAQIPGFLEGVDINALEAWQQGVIGRSDVIVAVMDGGVQVDHPDLKANMWTNPNPTISDDYGQDLHGYDFNGGDTFIDPDNHGTHVAGLIGAVRNNGLGVAGVAGGDGTKETGVRIMSCQIFGDVNSPDAVLSAFIYAADNGAVIANNSWGTGPAPGPEMITPSFKQAIDYFTDFAGCDEEGNQLEGSPMRGGLAIFAAGNQDSEIWYNPGSYSRAVGVASVGPTAKKALYTNHGVWVDIAGPGGDMDYGNPEGLVLSTITQGMYGYMQGTSQACPIVSGVAALIVSKFGGPGFTNEELRSRLLSSLRPFDIDARSPEYRGKLGAGIVDAGKALAVNQKIAPEAVNTETLKATPGHDEILLNWQTVKDTDDGTAISYVLFYAKDKKLTKELLGAPGVKHEIIGAVEYQAGQTFEYRLKGLELGSKYYFALAAVDRWNQYSDYIFFESETLVNHLPQIAVEGDDHIRLTNGDIRTLTLSVTDEDGHDWQYRVEGDTKGLTHRKEGNGIVLEFRKSLPAGSYQVTVTVSDPFGSTTHVVPFSIGGNSGPRVLKKQKEIFRRITSSIFQMELTEFFEDPDGETLTFEALSFNPEIVTTSIEGSLLTLQNQRFGTGHIEVTATDPAGEKARINFVYHVVNDAIVYSAYPVPVEKVLNIRLADRVYSAEIEILTPLGAVRTQKFVTVRDPEDRQVALDLSMLETGSYILRVKALEEEYNQTILKK